MLKYRRISATLIIGATLVAGAHVLPAATPQYTFTDLGAFGGSGAAGTRALGINNKGQITGYSDVDGTNTHAFLYSGGLMTDLGTLSGISSRGNAINDDGVVVGSDTLNIFGGQAIIVAGGFMSTLATFSGGFGGSYSTANAISGGQIVGSALTTGNVLQAFLREQTGALIDLPRIGTGTQSAAYGINSASVIVGTSSNSGDTQSHAFLCSPFVGTVDLTPALARSAAYAVNNAPSPLSRIVGSTVIGGADVAAYWTGLTSPITMGSLPGGITSRANAVNDAATIVGTASVNGSVNHAFIYRSQDDTPVMTDLNDLIPAGTALTLTNATGINNAGQICGYGLDGSSQERAFLLTPIVTPTPTPASSPTPVAAPTISIASKAAITTSKARLAIKGKATGSVTSVTYRVGSGAFKKAIGTNAWQFTAVLKEGKNVITIIAHGPGGDSRTAKIITTRK